MKKAIHKTVIVTLDLCHDADAIVTLTKIASSYLPARSHVSLVTLAPPVSFSRAQPAFDRLLLLQCKNHPALHCTAVHNCLQQLVQVSN